MDLKKYRINRGITIKEASEICNVPMRTYIRYENDNTYGNELKRKQMISLLMDKFEINEEKGILSIDSIKQIVTNVLSTYREKISFCYLFGSYAKGYARETSDVDLCVSTDITGLEFLGLIEELRTSLKKKVDLIRLCDLEKNLELVNEIMKDGVKIYG